MLRLDRGAASAGDIMSHLQVSDDVQVGRPQRRGGRMRRREFVALLGGAAAAWPFAAESQQAGGVYRIGFLRNGPPPKTFIAGFRQGLRELGYIEGRNIAIEYGLALSAKRLPEAAADLVRRNVDIIIASGTPPVAAAKNAAPTIPIVFVANIDPVATGMVDSIARPGGNVTGFTLMSADLMGKRLALLREIVPDLSRVAIVYREKNPGNAEYLRQAELGARVLGLQQQIVPIRGPGDFERAFAEIRGPGAVIQMGDVLFTSHRKQMVELATKHRLPGMYGFRGFVDAGGLISYGPDLQDQYRQAATYVDKILKGAKPADLPVQRPVKFDLVINLKTAKALGLSVPQSLLSLANEVIE
jgi:ABC-type uncharacterized transport system substrate-binding protein